MCFPVSRMLNPISFLFVEDAKFGARGARLEDGRYLYKSGNSVYTYDREPVYSIEDGVVVEVSDKFCNVSGSVAVVHGDYIGRYCKILPMNGLVVGKSVNKGDILGYVIQVGDNNPELLFEAYSDIKNMEPLTDNSFLGSLRGFQRREDLTNSLRFLMKVIK